MDCLTFLTKEELNRVSQSEGFKTNLLSAKLTDFSILLGASSFGENRTGIYWLKNETENKAPIVYHNGEIIDSEINIYSTRDRGARPVLYTSSLNEILTRESKIKIENPSQPTKIEYGFYPQDAISKELSEELEQKYALKKLEETGNTYTTDSRRKDDYFHSFTPQIYKEYQYQGKRLIRVKANTNSLNRLQINWQEDKITGKKYITFIKDTKEEKYFTLSNQEKYQDGDNVWIEVKPVTWFLNRKENKLIAEKILFSGIQFNMENYYNGIFKETNIHNFMNNIFLHDLLQNIPSIRLNQISPLENHEEISFKEKLYLLKSQIQEYIHSKITIEEQKQNKKRIKQKI